VRLNRLLRTASFRFSALYAGVFGMSVLLLSAIVYWIIGAALERQLDARIEVEAAALLSQFQEDGLDAFETALRDRQTGSRGGTFRYLLAAPEQTPILGTLIVKTVPQPGWSTSVGKSADGGLEEFRVLTAPLGGGLQLSVARDLSPIRDVEKAVIYAFAWAFAATLVLGLLGGLIVASRFLARVDSLTTAAEAIIDGNLKHRLPVQKDNDDLDFLAVTLNRMLDRINELMESVRQVSNDIAHDLRTPLSRLRHRLEAALAVPRPKEELKEAIEDAIAQTDNILATFSALLRIAHIEAGTRRSAFARLDFSALVADVTDAFAPPIQDEGKRLKTAVDPGICIVGDKELLTQLLANLLENAIRHTPNGTCIEVRLSSQPGCAMLTVSDNGPGVPPEALDRLFDRFYRPETSRTTPGSGLGLSLVKAVANLHNARIQLSDNKPGLRVELRIPVLG
jgi:signal transduction histidine kinase